MSLQNQMQSHRIHCQKRQCVLIECFSKITKWNLIPRIAFLTEFFLSKTCFRQNLMSKKELPLTTALWHVGNWMNPSYHKSWLRWMSAFRWHLSSQRIQLPCLIGKRWEQEAAVHKRSTEFLSCFECFRKFLEKHHRWSPSDGY